MIKREDPWVPIKFPSSTSLVVITRFTPSVGWFKRLEKKNNLSGLSVEQVLKKYGGFEAESHDYFPPTEDVNELINLVKQEGDGRSLLLVVPESESFHPVGHPSKLGYDVGRCEEEDGNVYSSIFHEILFGNLLELAAYKDKLNDSLLFPNQSAAKQYVQFHDKLGREGKDVEDYMEMDIYEVWRYV